MPDGAREARWLQALAPLFQEFRAAPQAALATIYQSFLDDNAMAGVLAAGAVPVVSFHFGLPPAERIAALKAVGWVLSDIG